MMIDFLNEDEFTMTQIHTEIDKAKELYHTLSGSIYSAVLYDEIRWAYRLLNSRKYIASEQERECYDMFRKYGLLKEL
jgi:hypothetical protein